MKTFAQINEQGIVLNTIVAESWDVPGFVEYTDSNPACIGGDYVDGYFYCQQPDSTYTRYKGRWVKALADEILINEYVVADSINGDHLGA
jgi:hypothetical protein